MWPFSRADSQGIETAQATPADEQRDIKGDWEAALESILSQLRTHAGKTVNADSALYSAAVVACVRVLAETIASLPCQVFKKRKDGGKDNADGHWLYPLLHDAPHPFLTSFEFREMLMGHLNLRGNAYSFKAMTGSGEILSLTPLRPDNMKPEVSRDGTSLIYRYQDDVGKTIEFNQDEIWHLKGLSSDGIIGLSPVSLAREAIGMALAAEDYGARFFANDARPGGFLKTPGNPNDDAVKRLKNNFEDGATGENRHRPMVLTGGLEWQQLGLSQADSQFLETRRFQVEEIARIFRVPTVLIGHYDKAATYASAEQFMLSFVIHTVRPWCVRWEQSINKNLLTERDREKGYFAEFNISGLLRGDTAAQATAISTYIAARVMCPNEGRKLLNMNPRPGGDEFLNPAIDKTEPPQDQKPKPKDANNG